MHHREINIGSLQSELVNEHHIRQNGMQRQSKIKYVNNYYFVGILMNDQCIRKSCNELMDPKPADKALDHAIHLAKSISINGSFSKIEIIILFVIPDLPADTWF